MTYHNRSKDDEGFGGCILTITFFFSTLFIVFLLGRSTVSLKKEIAVENNIASYIEAAEKLKLSYEIRKK